MGGMPLAGNQIQWGWGNGFCPLYYVSPAKRNLIMPWRKNKTYKRKVRSSAKGKALTGERRIASALKRKGMSDKKAIRIAKSRPTSIKVKAAVSRRKRKKR